MAEGWGIPHLLSAHKHFQFPEWAAASCRVPAPPPPTRLLPLVRLTCPSHRARPHNHSNWSQTPPQPRSQRSQKTSWGSGYIFQQNSNSSGAAPQYAFPTPETPHQGVSKEAGTGGHRANEGQVHPAQSPYEAATGQTRSLRPFQAAQAGTSSDTKQDPAVGPAG